MQAPDEEEAQQPTASGSASSSAKNTSGSGQTISGATFSGSSVASGPSTSKSTQKPKGGLKTLRDLQKDTSSQGQGKNSDEDDDGDNDEQDFYAGGEKSGLAVQNPNSADHHVNEMLNRSRRLVHDNFVSGMTN